MEMILSKDVREYIQKKGHVFTENEKATLIHNSEWSIAEKHKALLQIASKTTKEVLKQQIKERIQYEESCIRKIRENKGEYIYKLEVWEKEDEKYFVAGYFSKYEMAKQYARKSKSEFQIYKMKIFNEITQWDEDEWYDCPIAYDSYNEREELILSRDFETCCEAICEIDRSRFENAYVHMLHPFRNGDIVRIIGTNNVGIVRFITDETEQRIPSEYADYSDIAIPVEILCENAEFGHEHFEPMCLEYANLPEEDSRYQLLEAASSLVKGKAYIQEFQMACEEYRNRKNK